MITSGGGGCWPTPGRLLAAGGTKRPPVPLCSAGAGGPRKDFSRPFGIWVDMGGPSGVLAGTPPLLALFVALDELLLLELVLGGPRGGAMPLLDGMSFFMGCPG